MRSAPTCCPRCAGTRMLRVERVMDYAFVSPGASWYPRPVGLARASAEDGAPYDEDERVPIGHWETLICRACGYTRWFALDWAALAVSARPALCPECTLETPHVRLDATERVSDWALSHHHRFDQPRIVHGMVGWEGLLHHDLCVSCGHASWSGSQYHHLEGGSFARYDLVDDTSRACLRCNATGAILVDTARDYDGVQVPVTVRDANLLGFISFARPSGHFALRLCRPCGAVEWYARRLDRVKVDPEAGVHAIGERTIGHTEGPYR